jgi:membrane-associated phospholipid phosphatase
MISRATIESPRVDIAAAAAMRRPLYRGALTAAFAVLSIFPVRASGLEGAGTAVSIAVPVVAGSLTLLKNDWAGTQQLVIDTGLTIGTTLLLKEIVHEQRPDHSDFKSFPSDTSALAFAPAAFLWDRYGWQYGLPGFAAGAFVAYSRVDSRQHHWWDTAASALIAIGYSKLFTSEYRDSKITSEIDTSPDGAYLQVGYRW